MMTSGASSSITSAMLVPLLLCGVGFFPSIAEAQSTSVDIKTDNKYVLGAAWPPGRILCGPQQLTGFVTDVEAQWTYAGASPGTPTATTTGAFNAGSGTLTVPFNGFYHLCLSVRVKERQNGGSGSGHGDTVIRVNGVAICGTGEMLSSRLASSGWAQHQVCCNYQLNQNDLVTFRQYSGGSLDCIEETGQQETYTRVDVSLTTALQ